MKVRKAGAGLESRTSSCWTGSTLLDLSRRGEQGSSQLNLDSKNILNIVVNLQGEGPVSRTHTKPGMTRKLLILQTKMKVQTRPRPTAGQTVRACGEVHLTLAHQFLKASILCKRIGRGPTPDQRFG